MRKTEDHILKRLQHHVRRQDIRAYYYLFTKWIAFKSKVPRSYQAKLRKEASFHTILSNQKQDKIRQDLSDGLQWFLDNAHKGVFETITIPKNYRCLFVSVFESWEQRESTYDAQVKVKSQTWCQQMAFFNRTLFRSTSLYRIHPIPMYLPRFASLDHFFFTEYNDLSTFIKYEAPSKQVFFNSLISMDHNFIYISNFDFTHQFLIKDKTTVAFLKQIAAQHQLYLLD